jgi:Ca-activated chloride channel family protein
MRFGNPPMLWLLALTGLLLAWFLHWAWHKRQKLIAQFVQSRLLAQLTVGVAKRRQQLRLGLLGLAALLALLALARPQFGFAWEEVTRRGLDILVAVDTSRSMLATDVAPDRLTRAKLAALDLMRAARADRLGLIAFAGTAFLQCPLTLDDNAFSQNINYLRPDIIPQGGTAIAEAIDTAVRAFKDSGENYRVLVIITDGEDHEAGVAEAAERAAKDGIRIYTVGVGTPDGERVRVNEEGKTSYLKDEDGKPVVSKLNADLLQQVGRLTQGDYLPLRGADPMKVLYEARLAPLPRRDISSRMFRQYYERFQWPLGLAVICLVAELFITDRRRVERTEAILQAGNPALKRLVGTPLILVLLALAPATAQASSRQALKAYEAGKYREAQREFERLLQRKPNDPRLNYNAGTTAYRAGDFARATNELSTATLASDPKLLENVYYNLGNASYRLGEHAPDPSETIGHWKEALARYDSALKLNAKDADARFNRDLVAKKLEELEKQQPQPPSQSNQPKQDDSQKQDQQKDQKQERSEQERQPNKNQDSQDQQQKQPQPKSNQDQPDQKDQEPKPDRPQAQPEEKEKPREKDGKEQTPQPNPAAQQDKPPGDEREGATATPAGQMTPEQARQLLEAARTEESPWILVPPEAKRRTRTYREW